MTKVNKSKAEYSKLCSNCIHKEVCEYCFMPKASCSHKIRKKYCFSATIGTVLYYIVLLGNNEISYKHSEIKAFGIRKDRDGNIVKEMLIGNNWVKTKEIGKTFFYSESAVQKAISEIIKKGV